MRFLSTAFVGVLVAWGGFTPARAGVASSSGSVDTVQATLLGIQNPSPTDVPSVYANTSLIDGLSSTKEFDMPVVSSLPPISHSMRLLDRSTSPPVEPVPSPTAMSLGLVMLAAVAAVRIVRRLKLA
jgi:hypothetical protein